MDLNRASLIGFIGQDAAIKQSRNNKQFATFSLATSDYWKDKQSGDFKSESQWHHVTVFNEKLIEVVKQNGKKGARVYVEGKIKYRKYKDKNDVEKTTTDIEVEAFGGTIIFFEKKSSNNSSNNSSNDTTEILDDDIPF
jgi:single-strand DNA-binding protein